MTLLGKFYSRIIGSVEYLASESLLFILNKSKQASNAFEEYISDLTSTNYKDLHYVSQNIGVNKERPDISGFNDENIERIIIETKFWASLTENQPMGYLERIQKKGGVLVFICPPVRRISLSNGIEHILNEEKCSYIKNDDYIFTKDKNSIVIILSWDQLLKKIRAALAEKDENNTTSDLDQLIGLCKAIDKDSFLPIQQHDLSPEIPRRILSYYRIIDKVVDKLSQQINLSTQKLKTTPQKWGYRRYAQVEKLTIALDVNLEAWGNNCDTPLWIQLSEEWKLTDTINRTSKFVETNLRLKDIRFERNLPYFPIYIECNKVEDEVIDNCCQVITKIVNAYKKIV